MWQSLGEDIGELFVTERFAWSAQALAAYEAGKARARRRSRPWRATPCLYCARPPGHGSHSGDSRFCRASCARKAQDERWGIAAPRMVRP